MKSSHQLSRETILFLTFAFLFGATVRIYPVLKTNFPLVDGGMFYSMIRDLQSSHFALPAFTTYNHAGIPYAYPPLAFYIAGFVNSFSDVSLISIIKWQPVVVNLLVLPVFFLFTRSIVHSDDKAALATLIFALTPNSYWWQIIGGGLTRALGTLFFLLTALFAEKMYRERILIWIIATAISGAGAVLSHPEWALQAMFVMAVFWFLRGRDRQGFFMTLIVGLGIALITSPWWVQVIQQHGYGVFLQASGATETRWLFLTTPLTLRFTFEPVPVIAVLAFCGAFVHLARKDFLLPAWAFLAIAVDPRGGVPASNFPFSIMAMTMLTEGIAPLLVQTKPKSSIIPWTQSLNTAIGRIFWGVFIFIFLYSAYTFSVGLSTQSLTTEQLDAIHWAADHTVSTDRFLVLDDYSNPLQSPLREWFPALADRWSINTVQGSEWLSGDAGYLQQMKKNKGLRQCLEMDFQCINDFYDDYKFIVLSTQHPDGSAYTFPLLLSIETSDDFMLAFDSTGVKIFKVNR